MTKNAAPQTPTADDEELPQTGVRERESVRILREQQQSRNAQELAAYADDEPAPQGDVWEKRYGDLRRHAQKKEQELNKRVKDMELQVAQLSQAANRPMPTTREELDAWKAQYPQVAAIIETLADERAAARTSTLEQQLGGLSDELAETKKERAYAQLKALVPDVEEIAGSPEWQAWLRELPQSVQDICNNTEDPFELAKMVNKFKMEQSKGQPAMKQKKDSTGVLEAAIRGGGAGASRQQPYKFTVMQIKAMSPQDFEKFETEIDEARKAGLILDDSSRKVYHTDYQ